MVSADILVVDDTPANLHLLSQMLKNCGYKVRPVPSGALALKAIESRSPDLILLDISMPEMDGYTVCEQLKAKPSTAQIPVLFISALGEATDKVRGFKAGGVDYITKPFQFPEVEARVRTHLALRRKTVELERSNERLTQLERQRDSLTHMIVHDMRSPITVLGWSIETFREFIPSQDAELKEAYGTAQAAVKILSEMVDQMLDVSRMEAGVMKLDKRPIALEALLGEALEEARCQTSRRALTLRLDGSVPALSLVCDPSILRRVLTNLLGNAIKFSDTDGEVRLSARMNGGRLRVEVRDSGPGIAEEDRQRIFEKFVQVESSQRKAEGAQQRKGCGLGLTFCKMAVEAHGGTIGVESAIGQGSTFWFEMPQS